MYQTADISTNTEMSIDCIPVEFERRIGRDAGYKIFCIHSESGRT